MRKKRLIVLRVNSITFPKEKAEQLRQQVIKQLKSGVITVDKSCTIECYDYDAKQVEVKVISKDDELVVEKHNHI